MVHDGCHWGFARVDFVFRDRCVTKTAHRRCHLEHFNGHLLVDDGDGWGGVGGGHTAVGLDGHPKVGGGTAVVDGKGPIHCIAILTQGDCSRSIRGSEQSIRVIDIEGVGRRCVGEDGRVKTYDSKPIIRRWLDFQNVG